jgi:uncharacterized protein YbcI
MWARAASTADEDILRRTFVPSIKKADVVEHLEVFHHVGLLTNEPPAPSPDQTGRVALYLVVRRIKSIIMKGDIRLSPGFADQYTAVTRKSKQDAFLFRACYHSPMPLVKTQGEVEAAICDGISRFEQEYMGRGPKDVHAHLIGDLLVVRLRGVLTSAEQHLVKSLPAEKGRDLLKQVRTHLVETARPVLEAMIHQICGVKVLSLHHDISTATGEEIMVFTLSDAPTVREPKGRHSVSRIAAT